MEAGDLRGDVARAAGGGPDFGRIRYPSRARCGGQSAALSPGSWHLRCARRAFLFLFCSSLLRFLSVHTICVTGAILACCSDHRIYFGARQRSRASTAGNS